MTRDHHLRDTRDGFEAQVRSINKLLLWDRLIIDKTVEALEDRQESLKNLGVENAYHLSSNAIQNLKNIRKSEALHLGYELLHNQCVVLLVSYFSSAIHDIFNSSVTTLLRSEIPPAIAKKELKISFAELHRRDFDLSADIGEIVSQKSEISFQDMQSIRRAFKDFFDFTFDRDRTINNIVTAQACRHAIAHNRGIADAKLLNQIRHCSNRSIQLKIDVGDAIKFNPAEIEEVGTSMLAYCDRLINQLAQDAADA